jgi:hypothetical protein
MIFTKTIFLLLFIFSTLIITNVELKSKCRNRRHNPAHTWHTIFSQNGTWYGTLHVMTENERGIYFIDNNTNHSHIYNPFTVSESSPFIYGLIINDQDDFNMLYSLTLNQQVTPDPSQSNSRICVYLIGAERAAYPRIIPVSFHGNTSCVWQSIEDQGENFWVQ